MRALAGGFGPLPQDIQTDPNIIHNIKIEHSTDVLLGDASSDDDISDDDISDAYVPDKEYDDESKDVDLTSNLRRSKRLKRNK